MRNPLEIIAEVKNFINTTNSFKFPDSKAFVLNALAELENELTPQPVVEEVIEEPIIGEILEVTFSEPVLIEETIVEEPIVEEVAVKPTNKRPRKK